MVVTFVIRTRTFLTAFVAGVTMSISPPLYSCKVPVLQIDHWEPWVYYFEYKTLEHDNHPYWTEYGATVTSKLPCP
jgi:hypothetical protein